MSVNPLKQGGSDLDILNVRGGSRRYAVDMACRSWNNSRPWFRVHQVEPQHAASPVQVMSYDASNAYNVTEAYNAYRSLFSGKILMGIEVPPEAWGGHVTSVAEVSTLAAAYCSCRMLLLALQRLLRVALPAAVTACSCCCCTSLLPAAAAAAPAAVPAADARPVQDPVQDAHVAPDALLLSCSSQPEVHRADTSAAPFPRHAQINSICSYIKAQGGNGLMLWALQKDTGTPDPQTISSTVCTCLSLGSCSTPLNT